ncbi:MAG: hypothetical protein IJK63_10225 [Oscillospiraceae bacterium]|nr:hypothetical protein [Oscillospiraceae bacterium]
MRERLIQFMAGRNGNDALNRFLIAVDVLLMLLSLFVRGRIGSLLYPLFLILLVIVYFRMFSRNLYKRQAENAKYWALRNRFLGNFRLLKERWTQRKDYRFFSCPSCHAAMRVPRGRGKIKIVCRKCGTSFLRKS